MTNPELEQALGGLQLAIANESARDMEKSLIQIIALHDEASIVPMLSMLRDDFIYPEAMYDILHSVETFTAEPYVQAIISSAKVVFANAPDWAAALFARIMNGKSEIHLLQKAFRAATHEEKTASLMALGHLRRQFPGKFDARIDFVTKE